MFFPGFSVSQMAVSFLCDVPAKVWNNGRNWAKTLASSGGVKCCSDHHRLHFPDERSPAGDWLEGSIVYDVLPKSCPSGYVYYDLLKCNHIYTPSPTLIRTSLFEKVGVFDESTSHWEDYDL